MQDLFHDGHTRTNHHNSCMDERMSNEYYEEQWKRFRKSYDVKNKYHSIGQDYYFGDYKYEATQWHEKLLSKMHSTIKLEGRPDAKPRRNME